MYKVTIINGKQETVIHHPAFNDLKVQTGQINHGINVAESFSFSILPDNPGYHLIRPLRTLVTVDHIQSGKREFEGRVLMPTESMDDQGKFMKSFLCEGELGYLNDSCQRHGEYRNMTIAAFFKVMVDRHNAEVAGDEVDKKFQVGQVTVTNSTDNVYRYLGYESTIDSIFDKLIDRLGGELRVRKQNGVRYLDYLSKIGVNKTTEIRLAKNLKSIEKEADPSEIITRLIPLGVSIESEDEGAVDASQARLTIASVNGGRDYIEDEAAKQIYGVVAKSETWDDITLPANLLIRGKQFISENNRVKVKYVLSALDLSLIGLDPESFEVGNDYPVINPVMGIDEKLRVVEKTIDIIHPNTNSLSIGDLFKTASQYQNEISKAQKNVIQLQNTIYRQAQAIGGIISQIDKVNDAVNNIEWTLEDSDLDALNQAVKQLQSTIQELNDAIGDMPIYQPATETVDGLFSAPDKKKFNLITVSHPVDLDGLVAKVEALEGGNNG
ncbi:phage tail protein [Peribacillus simplex]|uniref:phage tail protein n=1 Tax=Peribacillus simplex TaxID=1478 RepID=UPI00119F2FAC|nr:phage tail protein [Peribacillus simplex]